MPIVRDVLCEALEATAVARIAAEEEMNRTKGPELRFLYKIPEYKKLYIDDLLSIGLSHTVIGSTGQISKEGLVWQDYGRVTKQGKMPNNPICYPNKEGVRAYCFRDFSEKSLRPLHIDQFGKEYYLKDLLFTRPRGLSSGSYAHWLATSCSQSMLTTFLRYFPALAAE